MPKLALIALAAAAVAVPAFAQPAAAGYPKIVPAPGGEVIIHSPGAQRNYDEYKFAPARRAGDFLYISGVVAGPYGGQARDSAALTEQTRRAFRSIEQMLKAAGAGFPDVVMINTFHVWDGPGFKGTRDEQFAAIAKAKDEFMSAPHPAWTAVGTTGLLADDGVVEIQMIAYVPKKK
jgi:enamine deaminase RidA (YjgF/YER057c/UK114 family)